jgi:hypothetical protein
VCTPSRFFALVNAKFCAKSVYRFAAGSAYRRRLRRISTHMRTNYKLYDPDYSIDDHKIEQLDQCVDHSPTQLCSDSNRHTVFKSSAVDLLRHTLSPLIFGNSRQDVVEAAPLTSSIAYFFALHLNEPSPWHPLLHLGIISGMLVSRANELDLDASFIACQWDTVDHGAVNKVLHQHYTLPRKVMMDIRMVVCIGRGIKPTIGSRKIQRLDLLTGKTVRTTPHINQIGSRPTHYL